MLLDMGLSPAVDTMSEGMAMLRAILQIDPLAKAIVITGNSDRSSVCDFIEKPVRFDVVT